MSSNTFIDVNIEKEGFGFIYKAGDTQHLADQIEKFVNDRSLVASMGANARKFAERNNFKDVWVKRLLEVINSK